VFPTASKTGRSPIGVEGLVQITASVATPVLAIGGITPAKVGNVLAAGAAGIAVLSAINDAEDPEAEGRRYRRALEAAMSQTQTNIDVTVNGKQATIPDGQTVHDYLAIRGLHDRMVVVDLNGQIIRRAEYKSAMISAGDRIEIVHFVGGGGRVVLPWQPEAAVKRDFVLAPERNAFIQQPVTHDVRVSKMPSPG